MTAGPRALVTTRVPLGLLAAALIGCGTPPARERDSGAVTRRGPSPEPVAIRLGEREVRVQCGVSCEEITPELGRLSSGCLSHPLSTPHLVTGPGALLTLGCCTEARTAYARACGLEGAASSCVSEWGARCERGEPGT